MMRDAMPGALRERLGDAAAEGLVQFLDAREGVMTEALVQAVVEALEPRLSGIDERLTHIDERVTHIDERVTHLHDRVTHIDNHLERLDRRFERYDDRFERIDACFTNLEVRVTQKLDTQYLAIDNKLSRVMAIQIGSITLFATIVGGAFVALLARL